MKMNTITLSKEKIYSGNLLLVNAQYPLKNRCTDHLVTSDNHYPEILMKRIAVNFLQLILEKISAGSSIVIVSGYRSFEEQTAIFEGSLKENGEEFTRKYVALPGHSEHQTGLAVDLALNQGNIDFICPEFPYDGICNQFRKIASDYGFIQRYTKDKEQITGISNEPWHFRYVGYPHSKIMEESSLSLEEYMEFIKNYREDCRFVYQRGAEEGIAVYYVPFIHEGTKIFMPQDAVYQISGNNADGFIVTVWG